MFNGRVSYDRINSALTSLQEKWNRPEKGVVLTQIASGWRFQSVPDTQPYLDRLNPEKPDPLGRAALEILAIIAYRQPVTRSDIEQIRDVAVRPQSLSALQARGWVEVVGTKPTIGRPQIYATTHKFLDDLGLASLSDLPDLPEPEPLSGTNIGQDLVEIGDAADADDLADYLERRLGQPQELKHPSE